MIEATGRVICKADSDEGSATTEKLLKVEVELNSRVADELYQKFGVHIRVHLESFAPGDRR